VFCVVVFVVCVVVSLLFVTMFVSLTPLLVFLCYRVLILSVCSFSLCVSNKIFIY
jgi:hypothetical protein